MHITTRYRYWAVVSELSIVLAAASKSLICTRLIFFKEPFRSPSIMFTYKNFVLSQPSMMCRLRLSLITVFVTVAVASSSGNQLQLPRSMKAFVIQPATPITKPQPDIKDNVLSVAKSNSASQFAAFVMKTTWLNSTLVDGKGNVTVFAFSDDAYNRSPSVVKKALANEDHPGSRDAVLQYHVALGAHYSKDIAILGIDTPLASLFPSPPLSPSVPFQYIHVDTYALENGKVSWWTIAFHILPFIIIRIVLSAFFGGWGGGGSDDWCQL